MATAVLRVRVKKNLAPLISEALFGSGAEGLEERAHPGAVELVTYGKSRAALTQLWRRAERALSAVLADMPTATIELDERESWKTTWTLHLHPVELTRRIVLSPTTTSAPSLKRGQRLLVYRPALAFGDGDHPTTRLAARAIERHYRATPGGTLLDIGAGTGVLSFVALLSGAKRAVGVELDPEALAAAKVNATLNGLDTRVRLLTPSERIGITADLVVINIELRPLLEVLANLPAAARRAPRLLATGFLADQAAQVRQALARLGFAVRRAGSEDDWVMLSGSST